MSAVNTTLGAEGMGRYMEVRDHLSEGTQRVSVKCVVLRDDRPCSMQGVEWLERQNTVLEEVDQLVELMAVEKETMSREISKLKVSKM